MRKILKKILYCLIAGSMTVSTFPSISHSAEQYNPNAVAFENKTTLYEENFENATNSFKGTTNGRYAVEKDSAINNKNESNIFKVVNYSAGYTAFDNEISVPAKVSMDFRMDGIKNGNGSSIELLGDTATDRNDPKDKAILRVHIDSSANLKIGNVDINDTDITEAIKLEASKNEGSTEQVDTTGWVRMDAYLNFETQKVNVLLTRISDGNEIYSGELDFLNKYSSLKEIYMIAGSGAANENLGGVFVDNIEISDTSNMSKPTMAPVIDKTKRQMENLGRGVVAVCSNDGIFVSWRLLATDDDNIGFNVYRTESENGKNTVVTKLNSSVLKGGTNFVDKTADITKTNSYYVCPVINGVEYEKSSSYTLQTTDKEPCYTIPLKSENKSAIRNVWVGDFDGDGEYDFAVSRMGNTILDEDQGEEGGSVENVSQQLEVYNRNGELLWSMDYGKNSYNRNRIQPGSATIEVGMWDGVTVYDIDCDGKAEVISKIANGVKFADGTVWKEDNDINQEIAVFDGETGKLKSYCEIPHDYETLGGPMAAQFAIGYLDGKTPSIICNFKNRDAKRDFHMLMCAYHMNGSKLEMQWKYDRIESYNHLADSHQMRVADIDKDGEDEVMEIGFALESDGTLKYALDGIVHGDRFYVGQFEKTGNFTGYGVQQDNPDGVTEYYYDASNGKIFWKHAIEGATDIDAARGDIGDVDPTHSGWEMWSFYGIHNGKKDTAITEIEKESEQLPYPSIGMWWDGDLLREQINETKLEKYNYDTNTVSRLVTTYKFPQSAHTESNTTGTVRNDRKMPLFVGDMIGDWREEVIFAGPSYDYITVFTTDIPSDNRIYTLAQNPLYRNCMTIKGYVESHQVDYYLAADMDSVPKPNISVIAQSDENKVSELNATPPKKTKYIINEKLDTTGLKVKAVYDDGSEVDLDNTQYDVTGFDSKNIGRQKITISYNGVNTYFYVTVSNDEKGIFMSEDFEDGSDRVGGNKKYWGEDTSRTNKNKTKIFGTEYGNFSYYAFDNLISDNIKVKMDIKLDACAKDGISYAALLGYDERSSEITYTTKSILTIEATASANGEWGTIKINDVDISDKANVSYKYKDSESCGANSLYRDSTGWLTVESTLNFGTHKANVSITRISDGSQVYLGEMNIPSSVSGIKEIYSKAGNGYGGIYLDNIELALANGFTDYECDFGQLIKNGEDTTYGKTENVVKIDDYTTAYLTYEGTYVSADGKVYLPTSTAVNGNGKYANGSYIEFKAPSDGILEINGYYLSCFEGNTYKGYMSGVGTKQIEAKKDMTYYISGRNTDKKIPYITSLTFTKSEEISPTPTVTTTAAPPEVPTTTPTATPAATPTATPTVAPTATPTASPSPIPSPAEIVIGDDIDYTDTTMTVSVNVANPTEETANCVMVAALYDENGVCIQVVIVSDNKVVFKKTEKGYIKVFLWDSFKTLKPILEPAKKNLTVK